MPDLHKNKSGFGVVELVVLFVIVGVIVAAGFIMYGRTHKTSQGEDIPSKSSTISDQKTDEYEGWKTETSTRAGFTIKHPADWQYAESVGNKDGVEHITIKSSKFSIAIDSYTDGDAPQGATRTVCPDCKEVVKSQDFETHKVGALQLQEVTHTLDNGQGNALLIRQPDSIYFLPSPNTPNVRSTFRGISTLPSLQDYQQETSAQFVANPDLAVAKKILSSLAY